MKKFFNEFKEFAMRGNVLDMAIGVVLGSAFGKITTSLVNDVFMPLIGLIIGGIDLGQLNIVLKPETVNAAGETVAAVTLGIGTFLSTIIDFILVAFVIFLMVKAINAFHKKKDEAPAPEEPAGPTTEELLTEIRDLLKEQKYNGTHLAAGPRDLGPSHRRHPPAAGIFPAPAGEKPGHESDSHHRSGRCGAAALSGLCFPADDSRLPRQKRRGRRYRRGFSRYAPAAAGAGL